MTRGKFRVEGEAGSENDERIGTTSRWAGDRGQTLVPSFHQIRISVGSVNGEPFVFGGVPVRTSTSEVAH